MGIDELNLKFIEDEPRNLSSYEPPSNIMFAVHDGADGNTEGLYWRDRGNTRWVKVSTEPPSNSTTIGITL